MSWLLLNMLRMFFEANFPANCITGSNKHTQYNKGKEITMIN